ncbi:hypothetical protein FEDK69T_12770 [Flavobacterium enshiense DK69]|uniref:hypothetical protein n=1 Tax=Flavobacterium enshiense TaxID=1341165 RepID=UPI0003C59254|nr:hypothetical protein [Flavobacterium enshiense]ESU23127.1 hypothetical protein FEDK69T_12770 [Flavobacterium enshiense DK69]
MKHRDFIWLLFFCCQVVTAQDKPSSKDSTRVYQEIEEYSNKNKLTKFVHKLLFKPTRAKKRAQKTQKKRYLIQKSFDEYEGKIIRNINIETLDPFGYSIDDENRKPETGAERFGNSLHAKTKKLTIRNILLIKKNAPLDSLVAKESERLIRRQRYTRSVIIKPVPIPNSTDSVDISVRVLDSWSLVPKGSISSSKVRLGFADRNFFGLGHQLQMDYTELFADKHNAYNVIYTIPSVRNTYINTTFLYNKDLGDNTVKSVKIERVFFSPFTRFAGGVLFENRFLKDSLPDLNNNFSTQNFNSKVQSYWFGHAFTIFKGKSEDYRTSNFVTTLGFTNVSFSESPTKIYDPTNFISSEKLYLASLGINTRKYAEDKYLFSYGIIEDVPLGKVYSITGGFQDKNNQWRNYFSGRFAYSDYYRFGYLGLDFEWGSFFNNGKTEETVFRIDGNYFTNLLSLGNWKIRQFIKPKLVLGNNRAPTIEDRVNFSDEIGFSGINSPLIHGTNKLAMAFQTQTYAPGNWYGFHFNPFFNMTFGLLGNETDSFFNDKLYSKFSLGLLINNNYFTFESFQISFSYYPSIPFEATNAFKTASFRNTDIALPDFQIGQPTIVPYN